MKNMDVFIKGEKDGSISLMNKNMDVILIRLNNQDEATDFSVRMLKFIGSLEFNDPAMWE